MIVLENIVKQYEVRDGVYTVLDGLNFTVKPHEKIGVLGRNGAGKSTLIKLLSGVEVPTSGTIRRDMRISWPLALDGGFQGSLTGVDNIKFICRVYGVDFHEKLEYIKEFSELGRFIREPVKNYSSGMRARLNFALSMAIDFDCYLIDEVVSVGDARFHQKCEEELFHKRRDKAMIIVSHEMHNIRDHCDKVALLEAGKIRYFEDIEQAIAVYEGVGA